MAGSKLSTAQQMMIRPMVLAAEMALPDIRGVQLKYLSAIFVGLWALGFVLIMIDLRIWIPPSDVEPLSRWSRLLVLLFTLGPVTLMGSIPALIWGTFSVKEKDRLKKEWHDELSDHSWDDLAKKVGGEGGIVDSKYALPRYTNPLILITISAVTGWILFFFSGGFENVVDLVDRGELGDYLSGFSMAHPAVYGFLGAYAFSLGLLVRGYFRGDLSPNLFMNAAYRMWEVVLVTFVAGSMWALISAPTESKNDLLAVFRFDFLSHGERATLIGATFLSGSLSPSLLTTWMINVVGAAGRKIGLMVDKKIPDCHQLVSIEGIDPYVKARLSEAGIEDVQNLAMADIGQTMVNARLGSPRIVDWIDQAIIRTYAREYMPVLNKLGIRTATDFILAYYGPTMKPTKDPEGNLSYDSNTTILSQLEEIKDQLVLVDENSNKLPVEPPELWKRRLAAWACAISTHPNCLRIEALHRESAAAALKIN